MYWYAYLTVMAEVSEIYFRRACLLRMTKQSTANVQLRLMLEMIYALLKTRPGDEVFPSFLFVCCVVALFLRYMFRETDVAFFYIRVWE